MAISRQGDDEGFVNGDDLDWPDVLTRMESGRVVIDIAVKLGLDLYQDDIDTAYLNAVLAVHSWVP